MARYPVTINGQTIEVEADSSQGAARKAYAQLRRETQPKLNQRLKESMRSAGRTVAEAAAPTILSTAGAVAGGIVGNAPGAIAGSAAGAGVGEAINPALFRLFGYAEPESMTGSRVADVAVAAGAGAAGEGIGRGVVGIGRAIGRTLGISASPTAGRTLDAMRQTGVTPKVTDVTDSRLPAMLERGVVQMPTGQAVTQTVERQGAQLRRAADDWLAKIGGPQGESPYQTGQHAAQSIQQQVRRTGDLENHLWERLGQVAHDQPVNIGNLKSMAQNVLRTQEQRLPAQRNGQLVRLAQEVLGAGDTVAWQAADAWRKGFGEMITSGELISKVPSGAAKGMYGAILKDMEQTAGAEPGLSSVYQNVRKFSERRRQLFRDSQVATVMETDPEKVVQLLDVAGGPTAVKRAREAIMGSGELGLAMPDVGDVEAWNLVRRHIFEGIFQRGTDKAPRGLSGEILSGPRLEKALTTLGDDTLAELVTPTERQALDNIVTVAKAIRASERLGSTAYTSTTPQGLGLQGAAITAGSVVGGALGGPVGGGAGGLAAWLLAPQVLARALTNPRAAELIASPQFAAVASAVERGGQISGEALKTLTRLGAILSVGEARE